MKSVFTSCLVFLFLVCPSVTQADQEFLKPLHDNTILRDKPDAVNSRILEAAQADWLLHATEKYTADDGSQWYEIYEINNDTTDTHGGFWYVYLMYDLPGTNAFVNAEDVEVTWPPQERSTEVIAQPTVLSTSNLLSGDIVAIQRYTDTTGNNLVLLMERKVVAENSAELESNARTKELFAQRFALQKEGGVTNAWKISDAVQDCELDEFEAAFITEAFHVTDLNNNGESEVWVPYILNCAGSPGPKPVKIIMYEGEKKYVVRAETRFQVTEGVFEGGDYSLDKSFTDGPAEFKAFAVELWEKHKTVR